MKNRRNFLAQLAGLASATALKSRVPRAESAAVKRIYIAADDHTDYMWTADEATYRLAFLRTIDHYLDLADQTVDAPADYQSRWNCDGLLWLREYEQHRSERQVHRLIDRVKSGHVSVPMTVLVACYGGTPTEAVLRGLMYGGIVERRYGVELDIAVAMENQTLPLGLASLWAGAGVKYSWKGICGCASKLEQAGNRQHDVYWWVGPDGRRVLMKWYSLAAPVKEGVYANEGPGGYSEARYPAAAIDFVDRDAGFQAKNPHQVIGLFGQGWDDLETIVPLTDSANSFPAVARETSSPTRRVIVSHELDYFEDMVATHGAELPEVATSFGNEWELYTASLAEVSATVKRATENLRAAEAMAVAVKRHLPHFIDDLTEARHQCWIAFGLYWEHDWTADGPISREQRATWQRKIARQITSYVDTLYERSRRRLGEILRPIESSKADSSTARQVFVFNPLSWNRTDVAEVEVQRDEMVAFVGTSKDAVPSQVVEREGKKWLRFLAVDVPPLGHVAYRISPRTAVPMAPPVAYTDGRLSSKLQSIEIGASGQVIGWTHSRLSGELIPRGGVANGLDDAIGTASIESQGEVLTTIRVDVPGAIDATQRTTRVTIFGGIERVEIDNHLTQNFSQTLHWVFQFNLDDPTTRHEEVGAIVTANLAKDGGDYADKNARTDWLTLNHFVAMCDDHQTVTLCNRDCLFFHLGTDITGPMDPNSNEMHVLAGGQVDGRDLGIRSQGGDSSFRQRFALYADTESSDMVSMKRSMEFQNPLVTGEISSEGGTREIAERLFDFESESVIVWAVKPSEASAVEGTIVRLWNLSDQPSEYRLEANEMLSVMEVTHVETDLSPIQVTGRAIRQVLPPRTMQTIKLIR